jgi:hypothetical protein
MKYLRLGTDISGKSIRPRALGVVAANLSVSVNARRRQGSPQPSERMPIASFAPCKRRSEQARDDEALGSNTVPQIQGRKKTIAVSAITS